MAIVKQLGPRRMTENNDRASAKTYQDYLEKGRVESQEAHYEGCSENWANDFELTAASWHDLQNNLAIEYVQSWDPDESKRMGVNALLEVGISTAREMYPGHQFAVVPQFSRGGNFHNHILICAVSSETGKRISSTYEERARMNQATDRRCLALGLSIPDRGKSKLKERLGTGARKIQRKRGITPIELQIMKAADAVRVFAIDLDDFIETLLWRGFQVEDRGEVLTYFHPNREKGIRDRRLGTNYEKEGLNERFAQNRKVFEERPELREFLREQIRGLYDGSGNLVGDASKFPFAPGGHKRFENRTSSETCEVGQSVADRSSGPSDLSSLRGFMARHIEATRSLNIVDYCNKNRIGLNQNEDGSYRLKGREHILIRGTTWENTKEKKGKRTGTGGGLLEFVENHRDVSVMGALAHLTGNTRFLLLDEYFGKSENTYKEFHVPKSKQAPEKTALEKLNVFAQAMGKNSAWNRALLHSKRVQVTTEGVIRFIFGKGEGAVEHKQDTNGKWAKKTLGILRGGLMSQEGSGSTAHVFRDPFAFMEATEGRGKMGFSSSASLLVLGDDSDHSLDFFLAANPHVKKVEFIGFGPQERSIERHRLLSNKDLSFEFMQVGGGSRGRAKGLDIEIKM